MYCIKCGVKLEDTEVKCPLCQTVVFHPDLPRPQVPPLYPADRMPKAGSAKKALSGALILLFLIPLIISFFSDLQMDGQLDWFGYVGGALAVSYVVFALPAWFRKPDPAFLLPCDFIAAALYLLYIDLATGGGWYLTFALPVTVSFALILCGAVTLPRFFPGRKLLIAGGALMAHGLHLLLIEYLLEVTFGIPLIGWSVYPLIVLTLLGGLLIYVATNRAAREMLERKLFF